jgi:mannitol/fructose-specific phosphotransferase system IIA component (Ntr-type)
MITFEDILTPKQFQLELTATTSAGAIHEVAELLKNSEKVLNWNEFVESLKAGKSCFSNDEGFGICIPHARTHHVSSMVMAGGRSSEGILFEDTGIRVHYIFVIGVPVAMAADYLRIIGALARIFRSPVVEPKLREARTKQDFLEILAASEIPL